MDGLYDRITKDLGKGVGVVTVDLEYNPGEVVISTTGRDSGRYFIIVEIVNSKYVKIADGDLRKIEDPKLKNIKHIKATGDVIEELSIRLREGKRIRNKDLRSFVEDYMD